MGERMGGRVPGDAADSSARREATFAPDPIVVVGATVTAVALPASLLLLRVMA